MENNKNEKVENQVQNQEVEKESKKISASSIITTLIIVLILAGFAGIAYYNSVVLPDKEIDDAIGYTPEDYIVPGQVDGFKYEITQEMFDEEVSGYNTYQITVKRAAKATDEVDFNYTGYVNGEKDINISENNAVLTIGENMDGIYNEFSNALVGLKKGETTKITVSGELASVLSENGTKYTEDVEFELKVKSVNKLVEEELTDKWVKENCFEDYGFETVDDLYSAVEESLMYSAQAELWNMAVDASTMSGYPEELYTQIYEEFMMDANYNADAWGMETMDYLYTVEGYTDATLEEEWLAEVQAELLMWQLVKEWDIEATEAEVEEEFEYYAFDLGYESVEAMKVDYTYEEIEETVLLDKIYQYIADNSEITISYTVPSN